MAHSGSPAPRRTRTLALAAALTLGALAVPTGGASEAAPAAPERPTLVDHGDGVRSLDVPLGEAGAARATHGRYRSEVVRSGRFSMVGVTWRGGARVVRVKVHTDGAWTAWDRLPMLTDGPDPDSGEGAGISGTDLQWVGRANAVRVEVRGGRPDGLTLSLMDPYRTVAPSARVRQAERKGSPRPRPVMYNRGDWGADPALRSGRPSYNRTIQQVHVHHTVNSNDYARADVPGLLRSIYRYHTQNLGWSDVGYNFLVDRFGRTWVGRAGGAKRPVLGAHTLGFNSTSTGVAVIGNFETADPGHRVITALVQLAAWKLHRAHRVPNRAVHVYSHGSDRYPSGRTVRLPAIDGHRDTNQTACPGGRLYRHLDVIRKRAAQREARFR